MGEDDDVEVDHLNGISAEDRKRGKSLILQDSNALDEKSSKKFKANTAVH